MTTSFSFPDFRIIRDGLSVFQKAVRGFTKLFKKVMFTTAVLLEELDVLLDYAIDEAQKNIDADLGIDGRTITA